MNQLTERLCFFYIRNSETAVIYTENKKRLKSKKTQFGLIDFMS